MKRETRKGKGGIIEKKCSMCGEWKPETEKYYYKTKKTGAFRDECKVCTAPFQKYRVESQKRKKAKDEPEKKSKKPKEKPNIKKKKPVFLSKRHTYKMIPETIEKIDIISNVSGMDKGEIITKALDFFLENNTKYELMITQYKKLVKRFRD
jgi:ATP-dependent protease Clp ATPase subunit